MRRFILVMICIVSICMSSFVYADKLSDDEINTLVSQINAGEMKGRFDYEKAKVIYPVLKASGLNDYQCSAVLANMARESSMNPECEQGGNKAIGLIQWDGGRRDTLQTFSKAMNDTQYTLNGYQVGGIETQVAFLIAELTKDGKTGAAANVTYQLEGQGGKPPAKYSDIDLNAANAQINDSSIDLNNLITKEEWDSINNAVALSLFFTSQVEKCGYDIDIYSEGAKQSPDIYKLMTGSDCSVNTMGTDGAQLSESLASTMVNAGLWGEDKFVSWKKMSESTTRFDEIILDSMSDDDIYEIENWKLDLEHRNEDSFLIKGGRWLAMLSGLAFILWGVFIYLAYWFDRINNFIELNVLKIVTFGKLTISPDEKECTFSLKELGKGETRTINHKKMIGICLISIGFGTFIVSGAIFSLLQSFVNSVLSLLS